MDRLTFILCMTTLLLLGGCVSSFERYYVPEAVDGGYAPVEACRVVESGTQDPFAVWQRTFPGAELLGRSEFVGRVEDPGPLGDFAAKLGADVAVWQRVWLETVTEHGVRYEPEIERTTVTTKHADGNKSKTRIETTRDRAVPYSRSTRYYQHVVLYLRTRG